MIGIEKKTTTIAGFVTDLNGNPIIGVQIDQPDMLGNILASTETDENGFYYFINVDVGDYTIQLTLNDGIFIGFRIKIVYLIH